MKCFTHAALCILKGDASLIISWDVSSQMWPSLQWQKMVLEGNFVKSYHTFTKFNLFFVHLILFWIDELIHFYSIYMSSMNIEFHLWYENCRRHFQMYLQWKCLNLTMTMTMKVILLPWITLIITHVIYRQDWLTENRRDILYASTYHHMTRGTKT